MREVDDAQHGEGQREADRHHGIGAADDEAVGELLQEKLHAPVPALRRARPGRRPARSPWPPISSAQPALDDAADLEQVGPMRDLQRLARVLLDHQDGDAHGVDLAHQAENVAHHEGREAERGLVHQQQLRRRDERARDRHHLLLAAAERAGDLVVALPQAREALEHLVDAALDERLVGDCEAADPQVVDDGQRVPQLPAFGHPGHAAAGGSGAASGAGGRSRR